MLLQQSVLKIIKNVCSTTPSRHTKNHNHIYFEFLPIEYVQILELTSSQWIWIVVCASLVGMAKSGIPGLGIFIVPILAMLFGGKSSTGILLPMLCIADVFAVTYYNRHAQWNFLVKLLPWATVGLGIGVWVGDLISDEVFKEIMAIIIFGCLGLMVWKDSQKHVKVPDNWWFSAIVGLAGGFATMIGNAAGPIMAVYLLSMHLPKNSYIGTAAWFFLIINFLKLPLHAFIWGTVTLPSLTLNLSMVPAIALGAFIGFYVVKKIPEKPYRIFIIATTAISALTLLL